MPIRPEDAVFLASHAGRTAGVLEEFLTGDVHSGDGYRMIFSGEAILPGDQFIRGMTDWALTKEEWIGRTLTPQTFVFRRKLAWECGHKYTPGQRTKAGVLTYCHVCSTIYGKRVAQLR